MKSAATLRVTGLVAIRVSGSGLATLRKHADPVDGARIVGRLEALDIARADASLIYCDVVAEAGDRIYEVEGAGADTHITAATPEAAATEAAAWYYSAEGSRDVTVRWCGTGPDSAVAEYVVTAFGEEMRRRLVVREVEATAV